MFKKNEKRHMLKAKERGFQQAPNPKDFWVGKVSVSHFLEFVSFPG